MMNLRKLWHVTNRTTEEVLRNQTSREKLDKDPDAAVKSKFLLRRQAVHRYCQSLSATYDLSGNIPLNHILLDFKRKLLYCRIPKVACTNWLRIMIFLTNKTRFAKPTDITHDEVHDFYNSHDFTLDKIPPSERPRIISSFFKFVFMRDPLERLISAYRDKSSSGGDPEFLYLRLILARIVFFGRKDRKSIIAKALEDKFVTPFPAFVRYALRDENEHWNQQFRLCHPCVIDYNIIARFENLDQASDYILHAAKIDHLVQFQARQIDYKHAKSATLVEKLFSQVTDDLLLKVYEYYAQDYAAFGFEYKMFQRSKLEAFLKKMLHS